MKINEVVAQPRARFDPARAREVIARHLTAQTLGRQALKQVPVVANVIFAVMVLDGLRRGDYTGAGLDLIGAVVPPSPAAWAAQTAIIATQLARSIYAEVIYGPGGDPMALEKDLAMDLQDGTHDTRDNLKTIQGMIQDRLDQLRAQTQKFLAMSQEERNAWAQDQADRISPEAGQAQAARAAASDRLRRGAGR